MNESEVDYRKSLRAAIYGLWSSKIGYDDFLSMMDAAISRGLTAAFHDGFKLAGILPEEMNQDELLVLDSIIGTELTYASNLADDIIAGRSSQFKVFNLRLDVWDDKYNEVRTRAQVLADKDGKFEWVLSPLCVHCDSCLALEGKVKRGSMWDDSAIYPRSPKLLCSIGCGCSLEKTTKPLSKGSLSSL